MKSFRKYDSISFHKELQGKIKIISKVPVRSRKILSLSYTPGVGQVVNQIKENKESVYDYTIKKNTVAVITDGSAVLGLGNVGPEAALPVMEGKCVLFQQFGNLNAFPICLNTQDTEEIISIIRNIAPSFGGINIEDISAPRCFEIEEKLQDLGIPVVHDDQHATAIVILAALINALKIVKKTLSEIKIVVVGSGAAGTAVIKLLLKAGVKNIIAVDRHGIISKSRNNPVEYKRKLAQITNPQNLEGELIDACIGADVLIGVSTKGLFTEEVVKVLKSNAVIFALANPDPEINPIDAKSWGVKILATGRSDFPNQVNNALVFPGLFKGLLLGRKKCLTDQIKINVANALASLIKKPTPQKFIPSIFDKNLAHIISEAVNSI